MTWNQRATRHLEDLAAREGISIVWCKGWRQAEAWVGQKVVHVPRIRKPRDYLVGLHELGHCASQASKRCHKRSDPTGVLACESAAWAWAAENVDRRLGKAISQNQWQVCVGMCFGSHVAVWAGVSI